MGWLSARMVEQSKIVTPREHLEPCIWNINIFKVPD